MREYLKLLALIRDYDNGIYEDKDFWLIVKDIANEGLYWAEEINQDNM